MTREEIFNRLIIVAINGMAANAYRDGDTLKAFCALKIADVVPFWDGFTDQTKIQVISAHHAELSEWIKSHKESND